MSEFAPVWGKPRMTKAQVKKYIKEMEDKREKAKLEMEKAVLLWELNNEWEELDEIQKKLNELL
jgi:hypothetical protein